LTLHVSQQRGCIECILRHSVYCANRRILQFHNFARLHSNNPHVSVTRCLWSAQNSLT
jgi:hypothetical protein